MLLVYYRLYITYTLAGFLFDLDQSNICRDIQKIEELVRQCLPIPQKTYPITKRLQTKEAVEKYFPAFLLSQIVPNNKYQDLQIRIEGRYSIQERRKDTLSRIRLRLTIVVIYFTKYVIKKEENMTMMFIKRTILSLQNKLLLQLIQGIWTQKDFPEQLSALPYKKKRNRFLSDDEKEYNIIHSKKRIIVEHTISRLKKYRIMSEIFRNKLRKYNRICDIVAGLVNYRIMNQC